MISVIIPTYQHASTLSRCLESVFKQTFKDVEVIVVDDGSTDGTEEVIKPYLDRIQYIKQANQGAPAARNRGFDASKGEEVIFCDADIVMRANMLEVLHRTLTNNPETAYAYSAFRFGWKGFTSYPFSAERLRQMNFIHTSALIRRADFPRFDQSLRRFQDWDLWLTILKQGKGGVHVPLELFRVIDERGRAGISQWRPSLWHRIPWQKFGWKPKSVKKYDDAKRVIAEKHGL